MWFVKLVSEVEIIMYIAIKNRHKVRIPKAKTITFEVDCVIRQCCTRY